MPERVRAFLGLGSNLGDRWAYLRAAVAELRRVDSVVAVSPVYETEPVGGPEGQGAYLNAVVELSTSRSARELLELGQEMENRAGRVRGERFGPRTLDVDVLLFGEATLSDPDLLVPHPRMWERRFVLAPLSDLDPGLVPYGWETRAEGKVRPVGNL